jgi:acyl-CoA reductase-like NAD-dependent aldehyde dehydrogenase
MTATLKHDGLDVVPLWINGKATDFDPNNLIEVNSAAQSKKVYFAQSATVGNATAAVEAAAEAFKTYSQVPYHVRRRLLMKAADVLESKVEELARYQMEETSCPETWGRFNVILAAKAIREIAASITIAATGEMPPPETNNSFCLVYKQPIGSVLTIAPWNGSIILSCRSIAAPLAAGCAVVFKASELCPRTHHGVVEAFLAAGLPTGVLNQIQAKREDAATITEAVISHPAIRKVEFIGSAAVGKIIGQLAAKYMKPILMELGGKNPAIVLKDADLQKAASLVVQGAVMHHGQVCMSTDRIIVEKPVADEFIGYLREATAALNGDAGFGVTTAMAQKAQKLVADAIAHGATLLCGENKSRGDTGAAVEPTFITNVKPDNPIYDVESFGPSASVFVVEDENEAIRVANDTTYGLTGAIHTKDVLKGLRLAKQLEVGVVTINSLTLFDESPVPLGGLKGSGWGKNNSRFGIEEFLVGKAVAIIDEAPSFGSS